MKIIRPYHLILAGLIMLAMAVLAACQPALPVPSLTSSPSPSLPIVTPLLPTSSSLPMTVIPPSGASITGTVLDPEGAPLSGVTVRIQATVNETKTDEEGRFVLAGLAEGVPVTVSAWKETYYCAKVEGVTPPTGGITFTMRLVQTNDNPDYQWIQPTGENSCYSCKPGVTQVWLEKDAHGKSAVNIRFLTMYNGTDVHGNQSPLTSYGYSRDYGRCPTTTGP